MASVSGALLGSWVLADEVGNPTIVFTFLADGSFLVADKGTPGDPTGQSGLEWGSYTWNSNTGAFSYTVAINTDGEWGMSHAGITSITAAGNGATLHGFEGAFDLVRVPNTPNSIVGSWYAEPDDGGTDQIVFNFFANGTFLIADKGTVANDPNGTSGIEWGTYTWNPVTGAFTSTVLVNTDGQWGFSDGGAGQIFVSGDEIEAHSDDGIFHVHRTPVGSSTSGSGADDHLVGGPEAEHLSGEAGDDSLDGGGGIDTAEYSGARAHYSLTPTDTGFIVEDHVGSEGRDTLVNIERLSFSDVNVALDLSGNAGTVAKILGAVFGHEAVHNPVYAGIGLSLLDGGMSYATLMQLALNVALPGASNAAIVDQLYFNVIGVHPSSDQAAPFVGLLDNHTLSVAQLGMLAANTSFNLEHIGFTGLVATGLEYV